MLGVSVCRVVWVRIKGGGGACWLPAGGIRASQGTFSSFSIYLSSYTAIRPHGHSRQVRCRKE